MTMGRDGNNLGDLPVQTLNQSSFRNAACPWQVTIPSWANVQMAKVMGDHHPQSAGFFGLLESLNLLI